MSSFFNKHGILGINARNLLYIRPYNKKKAVRLADDKLKTKQFLSAREVPVPKLYSVIQNKEDLKKFDFASLPNSFVLKPNMGYGGEGIIPFIGRNEEGFIKASGSVMKKEELIEHIDDILEGRFSLSGVSDSAFFEQLILCDDSLAKFSYKGLPDIRVVVHNLIPVMAMLRLPTKESDGKANLHQGALGVGIDIAKGTTTHIQRKGKIIDEIPEVGKIRGLEIPYWDEILMIASRVQLVTNLGYLAVDIVLDKNVGPVLLEINARAGLGVQIANLAPLQKRLQRIEGVKVPTPEKGVRIAQDMFGHKLEKEVKRHTGKEVIGSHEKVKILGEGETHHIWASINPLLEESIISQSIVDQLELKNDENHESIKIKFSLAEKRIQTLAKIEDLSGRSFEMIIGRRDLKDFLIDPAKKKQQEIKRIPHFKKTEEDKKEEGINFAEVDRKLVSIDRQTKLLYHLKPINLKEERELFFKDTSYEPQFQYPELKFEPIHLKEKLKAIKKGLDEQSLSKLYLEKIKEIENKIALIEAIGTESFNEKSIQLYGKPGHHILEEAKAKLESKPKHFQTSKHQLSMEEAIVEFEQVLKKYGLENCKVKVKKSMVATCLANKSGTLFIREGASFSEGRMRMLIAHEIETHILTALNGMSQAYKMFNIGFANYLETQEGLAVYNQEQVMKYDTEKNYRSATLVFVVDFALKHSFSETYDYCRKLGMTKKRAFQTTVKVKRGFEDTSKKGAFTKDYIYFSGYIQVKNYIQEGGDIKELYYGKYNLKDLKRIKEIPQLRAPKYLPCFLQNH